MFIENDDDLLFGLTEGLISSIMHDFDNARIVYRTNILLDDFLDSDSNITTISDLMTEQKQLNVTPSNSSSTNSKINIRVSKVNPNSDLNNLKKLTEEIGISSNLTLSALSCFFVISAALIWIAYGIKNYALISRKKLSGVKLNNLEKSVWSIFNMLKLLIFYVIKRENEYDPI